MHQDIAAFFRHLSAGKEILLDQPLATEFGGYQGALMALWVMVVSLLRKGPWMNSDECNSNRGFHCSMPFHGMVADL